MYAGGLTKLVPVFDNKITRDYSSSGEKTFGVNTLVTEWKPSTVRVLRRVVGKSVYVQFFIVIQTGISVRSKRCEELCRNSSMDKMEFVVVSRRNDKLNRADNRL